MAKGNEGAVENAVGISKKDATPTVDKDPSTKKRKRDEPVRPDDPKLREFLQVMKTGGASGIESELIHDTGAGEPASVEAVVPEGESDDEYEQIPARKEKQRRVDSPIRESKPPSQPIGSKGDVDPQQDAANIPSAPVVDTAAVADVQVSNTAPAVGASDDDWLRSRTNRLLDLVDADDLPTATPHSKDEPAPPSIDKGGETQADADDEMQDAADENPGAETPVQENRSPQDLIRRTSRLFIRNLPYTATEDDLRAQLGKFGVVEEVRSYFLVSVTFYGGDVMNPR